MCWDAHTYNLIKIFSIANILNIWSKCWVEYICTYIIKYCMILTRASASYGRSCSYPNSSQKKDRQNTCGHVVMVSFFFLLLEILVRFAKKILHSVENCLAPTLHATIVLCIWKMFRNNLRQMMPAHSILMWFHIFINADDCVGG